MITKDIQKLLEQLKEDDTVEVKIALFGQPGAGKSSLINKLIGKKVAKPSIEEGIGVANYKANGLIFRDLPGYDTEKYPKNGYYDRFKLDECDLFLCVVSEKFHQADTELFRELQRKEKICIFVVNKLDSFYEDEVSLEYLMERKRADIINLIGKEVIIVFTSCRSNYGIDHLEREIEKNIADAKKERWTRGAKAYSKEMLNSKHEIALKHIAKYSVIAAANGLNPIPGLDISIDVSILMKLFNEIKEIYGLTESSLGQLEEVFIPIVEKIIKEASREGILMLLKSVAKQKLSEEFSKYIPIIGLPIAASLAYAITSNAGKKYLDDCHQLAEEILNKGLNL